MKVTKKMIDQAAIHYLEWQAKKKEAEAYEKAWKESLAPIIKSLDEMGVAPDQALELRGTDGMLRVGKQREVRSVSDSLKALRLLESVEEGLGFDSMSIPLKALEAHLALPEYQHLLDVKHGARTVKGVQLPESRKKHKATT